MGQFTQQELQKAIAHSNTLWQNSLIDRPTGKFDKDGNPEYEDFRANGTLRHEDHKKIMQDLIQVRQNPTTLVADLKAAGLKTTASVSDMLIGVEDTNEFGPASRSMNPTAVTNDQSDYGLVYTPLPITHAGWSIPYRQGQFGYKSSNSLKASVRVVQESLDDMVMNGDAQIQVPTSGSGTVTIYGYKTHPERQTATISNWKTNPENIISDTLGMIDQMVTNVKDIEANSLTLYIPYEYQTVMQEDYSAQKGDRTFMERLMAIKEIKDIKTSRDLGATEVILIELSARTVEYAEAIDITTLPYDKSNPLDPSNFVTYSLGVPILKVDRNDRLAVLHGTV